MKNRKVLKIGFMVLAAIALIIMAPYAAIMTVPIIGMALTARTSDPTKLQTERLSAIAFSDATGGASPVIVNIGSSDDEMTSDCDTFGAWDGDLQINEQYKMSLFLPDSKVSGTGAFVNDLVTKTIPYVKMTYQDGTTLTLDSGDNNRAAMRFSKKWTRKNKAAGWMITGLGFKSVEATN